MPSVNEQRRLERGETVRTKRDGQNEERRSACGTSRRLYIADFDSNHTALRVLSPTAKPIPSGPSPGLDVDPYRSLYCYTLSASLIKYGLGQILITAVIIVLLQTFYSTYNCWSVSFFICSLLIPLSILSFINILSFITFIIFY